MNFLADKRKRKIFIIIMSTTLVLSIIVGACAVYVGDYYRMDEEAIIVHAESCKGYAAISFPDEKTAVFAPEGATTGLIFYPGGKVEFTAYLPLMAELAENGVLCVLAGMPFHLAVFDINAADGIREQYPEIEKWYIGGHSLGGSMAASYLSRHTDDFSGLVLLGSYSTADLSDGAVDVLSLYGSEDGVMNREKYAKYKSNLPSDFTEIEIAGGCHAYFGMYGEQDGDGVPTLSAAEQIRLTAEHIFEFIFKGGL